jgi:hypothetical protein
VGRWWPGFADRAGIRRRRRRRRRRRSRLFLGCGWRWYRGCSGSVRGNSSAGRAFSGGVMVPALERTASRSTTISGVLVAETGRKRRRRPGTTSRAPRCSTRALSGCTVVAETPLGWFLYVGGEQIGQPHQTPGGVFVAAMGVMTARGRAAGASGASSGMEATTGTPAKNDFSGRQGTSLGTCRCPHLPKRSCARIQMRSHI